MDLSMIKKPLVAKMKTEFMSKTKGFYNPENKGEVLK